MSHPFEPSVPRSARRPRRRWAGGLARLRGAAGQTTAEYALVLLGAAGIAMLLLGWATQSNAIDTLFNTVLDGVVGRIG